jgi:hypothetical protein
VPDGIPVGIGETDDARHQLTRKCGALVTRGASAEARNVPEQTRPLAGRDGSRDVVRPAFPWLRQSDG